MASILYPYRWLMHTLFGWKYVWIRDSWKHWTIRRVTMTPNDQPTVNRFVGSSYYEYLRENGTFSGTSGELQEWRKYL